VKPATPPGVIRTPTIALLAALLVVAWSARDGSAAPGPPVTPVKERDFAITAPRQLAAGKVELQVTNAGPDTHELLLVHANARPLPLRADNLTVDEQRLKPRLIGTLEDVRPGTRRTWKLVLPPGRYVLFCNMSGHYLGGMHRIVVVR
jgi:uncharacterized cupredoxin-like copper-binding protein